jgi:putative DNA primase/helicase
MNLLTEFAKKRKYDLNILKNNGWYEEDGNIKIKYTEDYIITRTPDGKKLKPAGLKAKPYFISGSSDKCVIVEGETDAIAMKHIKPDINVFAIGGTTSYKLLELLKYYYQGKKIILAYDNDDAGRICTNNTIDYLINQKQYRNCDIRVLSWIEIIKDIDEFYRTYGSNEKMLSLDLYNIPKSSVTYDGDFIEELTKITNEKIVLGKKIKCLNPKHNDSTPSMHIYKDHAYCFTCGYSIRPKSFKKNKEQEEDKFSKALGFFSDFIDMAEQFHKVQPVFYDQSCIWWVWDFKKTCYKMIDDIDLMNLVDEKLPTLNTVSQKTKYEIIESLKRVGRKHLPKDAPIKWVQFKDKAYSINSDNVYDVEPNYFFTNPVPWKLGETEDTPVMDQLFEEWVGKKFVNDLYELIAYSTYRSYPIQSMFCLYGSGRNGKSCYLSLLKKFVGTDNCCSTELDLLTTSRFEKFRLYKKLVCLMGETDMGTLTSTSLLKKLVGGDLIGYEKKGKDPFHDVNYSKVIIASNSLPSTNDTSDGFMRRWHILDFPNEFPEGKDVLAMIPEIEYNNLALKCTKILPKLLEKGSFTNQGTIMERKDKYIMVSNPLPMFLRDCCTVNLMDETLFISTNELYVLYVKFLKIKKRRKVSYKEFRSALENEGLYSQKVRKYDKLGNEKNISWVDGIDMKEDWEKSCSSCTQCSSDSHLPPIPKLTNENGSTTGTSRTENILKTEEVYIKDN